MKTLLKKLLYLLPIALLIIVVNLVVDPTQMLRSEYERVMAKELLSDKNVVVLSKFNDRVLEIDYIERLTQKKDIVVLGSSRTMSLRDELFPGSTFFNSSVSGASIEDYVSMYSLYKNRGLLPNTIIMGIDPWLFNKNNELTSWLTLSDQYQASFLKPDLGLGTRLSISYRILYQKVMSLISPLYFQQSLYYVFSHTKLGSYITTTSRFSNLGRVIASDGSMEYEPSVRERSASEIKREAELFISSGKIYSLEHYYGMDHELIKTFEKLIATLQQQHIRIIFILVPYNPIAYTYLINHPEYRIIQDVQRYVIDFAKTNSIPVIGSYNPSDLSLTSNDFYDGMHARSETINGMFTRAKLIL